MDRPDRPPFRRRTVPDDPLRWRASACDCTRCQRACTTSPGWFRPAEIERLARFLGETVEETFRRHLAIGVVRMPDGREQRGVMPHKLRDHKKPGSTWSLGELGRDGLCTFFDRGRCTIHPVRPFECARATHGSMERAQKLRHAVAREWTREALAPFWAWARGGSKR